MRKKQWGMGLSAIMAVSLLVAGCGTQNNTSASNATGGGANKNASFKVGLVTDTGGLNDHGFNHLAYLGVQNAMKKFGVTDEVTQSQAASDYVPNLTRFARNGDKLAGGRRLL